MRLGSLFNAFRGRENSHPGEHTPAHTLGPPGALVQIPCSASGRNMVQRCARAVTSAERIPWQSWHSWSRIENWFCVTTGGTLAKSCTTTQFGRNWQRRRRCKAHYLDLAVPSQLWVSCIYVNLTCRLDEAPQSDVSAQELHARLAHVSLHLACSSHESGAPECFMIVYAPERTPYPVEITDWPASRVTLQLC
jgi:hypothetical protein